MLDGVALSAWNTQSNKSIQLLWYISLILMIAISFIKMLKIHGIFGKVHIVEKRKIIGEILKLVV